MPLPPVSLALGCRFRLCRPALWRLGPFLRPLLLAGSLGIWRARPVCYTIGTPVFLFCLPIPAADVSQSGGHFRVASVKPRFPKNPTLTRRISSGDECN